MHRTSNLIFNPIPMPYSTDSVRYAQNALKRKRKYQGPIDGVLSPAMGTALKGYPELKAGWPLQRKVVGFIQLLALEAGQEPGPIDGLWGPQTEFAYNAMLYLKLYSTEPEPWRPEERVDKNPNNWPSQATDTELNDFYGAVGTNQTKIQVPYPHRIAWDLGKTVNSFSCHKKVHDSLLRVLSGVLAIYGLPEIQRLGLDLWGGCLNVRTMRGGTRYSTHSWGIAVDYDPARNQLSWGRDRASFARPEYEAWWQCWEDEGWLSLGRTRNIDWMHVQAAKL